LFYLNILYLTPFFKLRTTRKFLIYLIKWRVAGRPIWLLLTPLSEDFQSIKQPSSVTLRRFTRFQNTRARIHRRRCAFRYINRVL